MTKRKFRYVLLVHLFYDDVAELLLGMLKELPATETFCFFNVQANAPGRNFIKRRVNELFPESVITSFPAVGRDIGAKLSLIRLMFELSIEAELCLLIHDKKSPHVTNSELWRKKLYRIIEPRVFEKLVKLFETDATIGIIGSKELIIDEYDGVGKKFDCTSSSQIFELMRELNMQLSDFRFVAGTIFWARQSILKDYFANREFSTLMKRLEPSNCLDHRTGTFVHAWERILSWIANSEGKRLYGI